MSEINDIGLSLKFDYQRWLSNCARGGLLYEDLKAQMCQIEQALMSGISDDIQPEAELYQNWVSPMFSLEDEATYAVVSKEDTTIPETQNTRYNQAGYTQPVSNASQRDNQFLIETEPLKPSDFEKKTQDQSGFLGGIGQNVLGLQNEQELKSPLGDDKPQQRHPETKLRDAIVQKPADKPAGYDASSLMEDKHISTRHPATHMLHTSKMKDAQQTTHQALEKEYKEFSSVGGLSDFARRYAADVPAESADKTKYEKGVETKEQIRTEMSIQESENTLILSQSDQNLTLLDGFECDNGAFLKANTAQYTEADNLLKQPESPTVDVEALLDLIERRISAAYRRFYG